MRDRRKFYFLNRVRNKKNCAEHAWIKYFNVQKYIFLSNNTPDLLKFPIPMNASFVNLYFHRVKYRGEEEEEEKEEERDVEDGWPATIFLTRGERFDQRLAEGILFHPPAPGVFCPAPLSLLFVPHPLSSLLQLSTSSVHCLSPLFCKTSLGPLPSSRLN